MMRSILVPAALVLLTACGGGSIERPFFTEPPSILLPSGARTDRNLVAVCYSSATTSAEALRTMVGRACENPRLLRQDLTGGCTMVQPVRATFACSQVDREVARVEVPFIKGGDQGRFRLDPEVPGEASRELLR